MDKPERFIVIDLEATCWEDRNIGPNEIIEVGAVAYARGAGLMGEFQTFVRPQVHPQLSDFCRVLTHIRQEDVEPAPVFRDALNGLIEWSRPMEPFTWASWGDYDRNQLGRDCVRHGITWAMANHVNVKARFAQWQGAKPCGMAGALARMKIPLAGTHHRGIDDARNISKVLDRMVTAGVL